MNMAFDLFDEMASAMWNFHQRSLTPLTTVIETESTVIVEVDLPLVSKKDIQIRLIEQRLQIEASLRECLRYERWGTIQRDCEFTTFYASIPLPTLVSKERATATFRRGLLRIELSKQRATTHRIPIE
jgi:HSP20 family protein